MSMQNAGCRNGNGVMQVLSKIHGAQGEIGVDLRAASWLIGRRSASAGPNPGGGKILAAPQTDQT